MNFRSRILSWLDALENRVLCAALMAGSGAVLFCLAVLWRGDGFSSTARLTLTAVILGLWLGFSFSARKRVVSPLRTLANLLEAVREGDYSIRGRKAHPGDALGEVLIQVNAIGDTLRAQRLGAVEATALLSTVMQEIDVAVFTFDGEERLRFVNRAGERLLSGPAELLLGRTASDLHLAEDLHHPGDAHSVTRVFPGASGRWSIRRGTFRESGLPHTLLVISDLTRALREEELQAWQRLVRVLGHELNNSLTPIKSISGSLAALLEREPPPPDWRQDMRDGLGVVAARAGALSRFLAAYSRLARLPRPRLAPVELRALVHRAASLETRVPVQVGEGPALTLHADADQIEQLLINLVRNAADAALEAGGPVRVEWDRQGRHATVRILDDGPGLSNTANLFVPFFTTKPGGSGIGLLLSRQIAEAHGGSLSLANRAGARGCQATLILPIHPE